MAETRLIREQEASATTWLATVPEEVTDREQLLHRCPLEKKLLQVFGGGD
ncbi:hypothetical protein [Amycolatopsis sp. NPDC004079]